MTLEAVWLERKWKQKCEGKAEQVLCRYISYYDPPLWIDYIFLHDIRDIYRRYFLRNIHRDIFNLPLDILNIPEISLVDYKEDIGNYTKYLEKKSKWVGAKIFEDYTGRFRKSDMELQKFRKWLMVFWKFSIWIWWCENFTFGFGWCEIFTFGIAGAKFSHLELDDAKFLHLALADAKFIFNLVRLSSDGHNFFSSALICTSFEVLDSWLPKIRKNI